MKCPCENCVVYAMCRTKVINMPYKYTKIGHLAVTCDLLFNFIHQDISDNDNNPAGLYDDKTSRTGQAYKIFNIESVRDLLI